jgi:diguanylate cyclase (GGDEF)-like protein
MSDVVELGLRRPSAQPGTEVPAAKAAPAAPAAPVSQTEPASQAAAVPTGMKGLADAFLKTIADFAPDADAKDVKEFVESIKDYRDQIALSGHDQETRRLASAALRNCEQYLRRSRHYYATREGEFQEMIDLLRETAKHIAGDNTEFHAAMKSSTDRFRGMAHLEDIRELKKQLATEATTLQRTVEAKQKKDEQTLSALSERVQTLQANLVEAEEQASQDPLTKIANRGAFDRALAKAVKKAKSSKTPLSLAMIDIDHFKKINDTHGHPIGDRVILCVAQWVTAAVRHTDVVARYGGEEFGVILADADLAATEARFKSVVQQIASRSFEYQAEDETRSVRFTVSCGVTQFVSSDSEQDLVQRADQALYDAKKGGRNRLVSRKKSRLSGLFG